MFEFVCGTESAKHYRSIHFHIRRFSINEIPKGDEDVKKWLAERYIYKNS